MSTEIIKKTPLQSSLEVRNMDERTFRVIKEILYPNVQKDETLLMAIDYCKSRNLDIMKRTIQIVPIWDSKTKAMKDTIWPSIAEIRITATRTGKYAGISEAEFGDDVTEELSGVSVTYPKWCKITVYRLVEGEKCSFTAKLFWKQEYKTAKNDTSAPNSMWGKRTHSQLEKCTEAAALRKAFPEELGNMNIAEEAFDANEGMLNVTPKPKQGLNVADLKSSAAATVEAEKSDTTSLKTHFQDQEEQVEEVVGEVVANNEELAEQAFKRVSDGIKSMANPNSVKVFFERSAAEDLEYLKQYRPEYLAELVSLKAKRLEELSK